jgi:UDP-N-acetylglucosamine 2-epimerase
VLPLVNRMTSTTPCTNITSCTSQTTVQDITWVQAAKIRQNNIAKRIETLKTMRQELETQPSVQNATDKPKITSTKVVQLVTTCFEASRRQRNAVAM